MKQLLISFLFLFLIKSYAIGQDTITIPEKATQITCDGKESYFFTKADLPLEKLLLERFQPKDSINLQYVTGWVWVKFVIQNTSNTSHFVLNATSGHISGFYLYKPTLTGYHMTPPAKHHPEDGREVFNRLPCFFIELDKGETKTFYMKIRAEDEVIYFNTVIRDYQSFVEYAQADYIIIGLYLGALLIIIAVNIFYFVSLKDTLFLIYAIYVLDNFLSMATLDGFSWLLIPDSNIAYHVSFFCLRFWTDTLLFFTIQLVNLKQRHKIMAVIAYGFIFYHTIIMAVLELTNVFNIRLNYMGKWELINCLIGITLVFVIIVISYKDNKYLFKYYLVAFGILLVAITIFPLYAFGGSENYLLIQHGMKAGTLLEMLTLSFAVSRRFKLTENDLNRKKIEERQLNDMIKQLEMDVRKAQMNPHFMFNALTSIEYFILNNDSKQARNYLGKFSKLMRLTLDHSRSNYVSLRDELDALKLYIELEFLRLNVHGHHFEIRTPKQIDLTNIMVPPLLIQPIVENAIWHGLQRKDGAGKLIIDLRFIEDQFCCTVEDDGPGMTKELITNDQKASGLSITKERLTLIHAILNTTFTFSIENRKDKQADLSGTCVQFNIPYVTDE